MSGCKMKHSRLSCKKGLWSLQSLLQSLCQGYINWLTWYCQQSSFLMQMVLSIRKGYQKILINSSSASTLLSNNVGDSSDASSSKQTVISICTNKQLVAKAEVIWVLDVCLCPSTCSSQAQIKVICLPPCFLMAE